MPTDTTNAQVEDAEKAAGESARSNGEPKPRAPRSMPDVARMYIDDQAEAQTPMVFVTRDGELHATVVESGMYEHVLNVDGEATTVKKVMLEYHYKQIDADTVAEKLVHDPSVDPENVDRRGRWLANRQLWVSRKQHIPVRATLRAGAQFTGLIEWFTPYAIKLNIGLRGEHGTASVVLHRHAVAQLDLLEEPKDEPRSTPKE
jgi:sRNA-binding regulator protein Hfq